MVYYVWMSAIGYANYWHWRSGVPIKDSIAHWNRMCWMPEYGLESRYKSGYMDKGGWYRPPALELLIPFE